MLFSRNEGDVARFGGSGEAILPSDLIGHRVIDPVQIELVESGLVHSGPAASGESGLSKPAVITCGCPACSGAWKLQAGSDLLATAPIESQATPGSGPQSADTVPGDLSTATSIAVGGTVSVNIETPSDHDWYRVTLTAGVTYTIQSYQQSPTSNPDSYLQVRDATGALLQEDDDSGNNTFSLIAFTPNATGTYYIDAATYSGQGQSSSGVYYLGIAALATGGDAQGGTVGTAQAFGVGQTIDAAINSGGDHDFFAVQLTAGTTYIFRTAAATTLTDTDTRLTLRDGSGAQILTNDDAGEAAFSAIRFTATTSGTYYLDVSGFSGTTTGAYNLTAFVTDTPTLYTNDQIALQLTTGYWGGQTRHFNVTPGGILTFNVQGLTAAGQTLARAALGVWTEVSGITFQEVTSGGQIVYDDNQDGAFATSVVTAGGIITSSAVNVATQWLTDYGTGLNTYSFQTYLHETGHALGLGHAGNYNGSADYTSDSIYLNDAWSTTVMSYFDQNENTYFQGQGFTRQFMLTPMVADAIAIASLYGANTLTRTGNTVYGFNNTSGSQVYDATLFPNNTYTIFDSGGIDTLDYSGYSNNQRIDLNAESFSNIGSRIGNVSIARGTVIENAVGGSGNDTIIGNAADNLINASRGGDDSVSGGAGNDGFYFGAAFTAADVVDGGAGALDQLALQGNYAGGVTLAAVSLVNVEQVVLLSGADASFGDTAGNSYSYALTLNDANVAAGGVLSFSANTLRASENFTLNASAETNGQIVTYGGAGVDSITGGQGSDGFFFGNSLWGANDRVDGQGGNFDQLAIQGNYTGGNAISFGASQLVSIESLVLLSASDLRFGNGGAAYSYAITMNDANVAAGATFSISANTLTATETVTLNAQAETNAAFTLFLGAGNDFILLGAGNDRVFGGGGNDLLVGGLGADQLTGGAGNDVFAYLASDSPVTARDQILDFTTGDRIDFGSFDANSVVAGNQGFTWIGSANFTGAGQLHVVASGSNWLVEGDINGDGQADISILVTSDHQLGVGDFIGVSNQAAAAPPVVELAEAFAPAAAPAPDFAALQLFTHELIVEHVVV